MAAAGETGEAADDNVFDETADTSRIAEVEWQRLNDACTKEGLREGLSEGKEAALQAGFDRGFREGFQLVRHVSLWRGLVRGVCSFLRRQRGARVGELTDRLAVLERDLLAGQASDGRVHQARRDVEAALREHQLPQLCQALDDA
uniref:Essential protein Yae1 N-terminal domain-containing protein n=1 Tax=Ixodes ricinus TaxID=34613 RepID=A0A090X7I6_IXORI